MSMSEDMKKSIEQEEKQNSENKGVKINIEELVGKIETIHKAFYNKTEDGAKYKVLVLRKGINECLKAEGVDLSEIYSLRTRKAIPLIKFLAELDDKAIEINEITKEMTEEVDEQGKKSIEFYNKVLLLTATKLCLDTFKFQIDTTKIDIAEYTNTELKLSDLVTKYARLSVAIKDVETDFEKLYTCLINISENKKVNPINIESRIIAKQKGILDKYIRDVISILMPLYTENLTALSKPLGILGLTDNEGEKVLRCFKFKHLSEEDKLLVGTEAEGELEQVNFETEEGSCNLIFGILQRLLPRNNKGKRWGEVNNDKFELKLGEDAQIYLPYFHAIHLAGYYKNNDGELVELPRTLEGLKKSLETVLYEELSSLLRNYIIDMLKFHNYSDEEKKKLLNVGSSPEVENKFYTHLKPFVDAYTNVLIMREEPSTGILWLQYHFQITNDKGEPINYGVKIAKALVEYVKVAKGEKSDSVSATEQNSARMIFGKSANVICSEITDIPDVYNTIIVTDNDKYVNLPNFAYKPILAYLEQGREFSLNSILLGKTLQNKDIIRDFSDNTLAGINIFADSRSGKGVMTLSVLLALMAGGNPVVYGDFKPDMSLLFNNVKKYLGKATGQETKFLACEFATEYDPNSKWYKVGKFDYDVHWQKATTANGINEFFDKWHLSETERETWLDKNFFGVLAYCKYVQLVAMAGETFEAKGRKFVFVCDELKAYNTALRDIQKSLLGPKLSELADRASKINSKKAAGKEISEEDLQLCEDYEWCNSFCQMYFGIINKTGNLVASTSSTLASYFENKRVKKTGRTLYICIGQSIAYHLDPNGKSQTSTPAANWSHSLIEGAPLLIQGNWMADEDLTIGLNKNISNAEFMAARSERYIHKGTKGTAGFFALSDSNGLEMCKTYLILNENDYDADKDIDQQNDDGYAGGMLTRFNSAELKKKLVDTELCPGGKVNELVGYAPLLLKMAERDPEFISKFNKGYEIVENYLKATPIGKKNKYKIVEDYIYDFHIDAIPVVNKEISLEEPKADEDINNTARTQEGSYLKKDEDKITKEEGKPTEDDEDNPLENNEESFSGEGEDKPLEDREDKSLENEEDKPLEEGEDKPLEDGEDNPLEDVEENYSEKSEDKTQKDKSIVKGDNSSKDTKQVIKENPKKGIVEDDFDGEVYKKAVVINKKTEDRLKMCCSIINTAKSASKKINARLTLLNDISTILMSTIADQYGGYELIKSFEITNDGELIIDGILFKPEFPQTVVAALPIQYRTSLKKNNLAEFFLFNRLNKFTGLEELIVESERIAEGRLKKETGYSGKSWVVFKKDFKLTLLMIGGEEIVEDKESQRNGGFGFNIREKLSGLFGGRGDRTETNELYRGYSVGSTIVGKLFNTTPVRALTTAAGWTLGLKAAISIASFLGPIGWFFGAVAGVSAYKLVKQNNQQRNNVSTRNQITTNSDIIEAEGYEVTTEKPKSKKSTKK